MEIIGGLSNWNGPIWVFFLFLFHFGVYLDDLSLILWMERKLKLVSLLLMVLVIGFLFRDAVKMSHLVDARLATQS